MIIGFLEGPKAAIIALGPNGKVRTSPVLGWELDEDVQPSPITLRKMPRSSSPGVFVALHVIGDSIYPLQVTKAVPSGLPIPVPGNLNTPADWFDYVRQVRAAIVS